MSEIAAYKDEAYVRGKAPITKREIRILTIALLGVGPQDVVVDIGAGTGGLTREAARNISIGLMGGCADLALRTGLHPAILREQGVVFHGQGVNKGLAPGRGQRIDRTGEIAGVGEHRGDVLEHDAGLGEVGDVADPSGPVRR